MTSGPYPCHKCGEPGHHYHYTKPRSETPGRHEGYWHCDEHGPFGPLKSDDEVRAEAEERIKAREESDKPTTKMNRRQRRFLQRKRAKEQRKNIYQSQTK